MFSLSGEASNDFSLCKELFRNMSKRRARDVYEGTHHSFVHPKA